MAKPIQKAYTAVLYPRPRMNELRRRVSEFNRIAAAWLEQLPKQSRGAEIGVWKGDFTQLIYDIVQPTELHLVDPWEFQPDFAHCMYGGKVAKSQADMNMIHAHVMTRFEEHKPHVHRCYSSLALDEIEDESLDWVYIDGNHAYEYVRDDLNGYIRKLVPGGLLTGDDYLWAPKRKFPVKRAVNEMCTSGRVQVVDLDFRRFILRKN